MVHFADCEIDLKPDLFSDSSLPVSNATRLELTNTELSITHDNFPNVKYVKLRNNSLLMADKEFFNRCVDIEDDELVTMQQDVFDDLPFRPLFRVVKPID